MKSRGSGREIAMRRREFMAGAISAAAVSCAAAQQPGASKRIAIFSPSEPSANMHANSENRYYRIVFDELRRLGYAEGQNLTVEGYGREQNTAGPEVIAADIVRSKPDIIYVVGPGVGFFKKADIPIVTVTGDPVAQGLVQSLAHPGGNITGASVDTGPSIHGKRIALLREMFPAMSKLACITLRIQWNSPVQGPAIRTAAETAGMGLAVSLVDFGAGEAEYRAAIANASREGANAIMIADSPDVMANRALIAKLVNEARLPAIFPFFEIVEAGGLMAYSFDLVELNKRAASDIDAILRGANPADIPFYQASKFELSINLRTAKLLGLTVPPTLLASADNVIE